MDVLDPASDPRGYRRALGAFATGVTVVTTVTDEGPVGITANSFSSVSLDPPLILWAPDKGSRRYDAFARAGRFAINVLAVDQHGVCDAFRKSKDAFDAGEWETGADGIPVLARALAVYECAQEALHDAGDHALVIGRVLSVRLRGGLPLVFHGGAYGAFAGLEGGAPPE
ncbi:flavin reductase family protein [Wenxinia marina]|uniref:Conserved protein/domain typically associated with flavoprotein oxygenase, DIM6/NTAB family n=1 Tax=Wenxinia marina DSM 24838 TaxID=1123501 RepID=A0A0D0NM18_9RHOB|nr:flavin reductase family protein [Wenxinia marina]KIQ69330.1 Conserved protein/domain typically associated with flavoprotein oxygenase, DIM6/NTAB family [Wenxinia marina DSM 24838]GGL57460.1 flavin oxidoreductase [Wenxinia marina]